MLAPLGFLGGVHRNCIGAGEVREINLTACLPGAGHFSGEFGETHAAHGACIDFPRMELAALEAAGMVVRCEQVNVAMSAFSCRAVQSTHNSLGVSENRHAAAAAGSCRLPPGRSFGGKCFAIV